MVAPVYAPRSRPVQQGSGGLGNSVEDSVAVLKSQFSAWLYLKTAIKKAIKVRCGRSYGCLIQEHWTSPEKRLGH